MKTIKIELHSEDYCPLTIEEEGKSTHQGGGNVYCAVVGLLAEATGDQFIMNKWNRLNNKDRTHIARIMKTAFETCKEDVKYYFREFYEKPKPTNPK